MDRFLAGYGVRPNRAELVHHMIPLEERPDLALDLDNLRSLCSECHNRRHPEKGRQAARPAEDGSHTMRVITV